MAESDTDQILRRIEALEANTERRISDARDIHRREHEAWEDAHHAVHDKAEQSGRDVQKLYEMRFASEEKHRDEARVAMDRRLEGMNEIRAQLNAQAATFVTIAAQQEFAKAVEGRIDQMVKAMDQRHEDSRKHTDERYEDNRKRIEQIEKGDVKQEGRGLGQSATVALIVGSIAFVGTVLGIIITLANFATGS